MFLYPLLWGVIDISANKCPAQKLMLWWWWWWWVTTSPCNRGHDRISEMVTTCLHRGSGGNGQWLKYFSFWHRENITSIFLLCPPAKLKCGLPRSNKEFYPQFWSAAGAAGTGVDERVQGGGGGPVSSAIPGPELATPTHQLMSYVRRDQTLRLKNIL